ncbi:MAG: hypothetical protein K9M81_03390 [Chthoniobacterales bacterium]|nr:hypothetical protein [Chthoniobacterales bacterium]
MNRIPSSSLTTFLLILILLIPAFADDSDPFVTPPTIVQNPDGSTITTSKSPDGSSISRIDKSDGTTITTVTKPDRSSEKTINYPDGSSVKTIDHPDGSSLKLTTHSDGSWVKIVTTSDGEITTEKSDSSHPNSGNENSSSSGEKDDPSKITDPKASPSPEEPTLPHFETLNPPFEIKQIPVFEENDQNGKPNQQGPFFYISESCITGNEYCAFLNAVATKSDPYELYSDEMAKDLSGQFDSKTHRQTTPPRVAKIAKNTLPGGTFHYDLLDPDQEVKIEVPGRSYKIHRGDLPISSINLLDAARFCNWLHNGEPTAPEGPNTTETGAYIIDNGYDAYFSGFSGATKDTYRIWYTGIKLQEGARWSVPLIDFYFGSTQNEIHKNGLFDNYGMFYSQQGLQEWTSTRSEPSGQSDTLYHRNHNLITQYYLVHGTDASQKANAATYTTDKVEKGKGPPPVKKDGYKYIGFRVMKINSAPPI